MLARRVVEGSSPPATYGRRLKCLPYTRLRSSEVFSSQGLKGLG